MFSSYLFILFYIILNYFILFHIIVILYIINRFISVRCLRRKETLFLVLTIRIS